MWKMFFKTEDGMFNGVPKENYSHTLEPWKQIRKYLNLSAKVLQKTRMRLEFQNEATVAGGQIWLRSAKNIKLTREVWSC